MQIYMLSGVAVVGVAIVLYSVYQKGRKTERAEYNKHHSSNKYPNTRTILVHIINNGWDADQTKHSAKERNYWRSSVGLSIVYTILTAVAAFLALRTYIQADNTFKISNRPWMTVASIQSKDGKIYFVFTNIGKTPTNGVYIAGDLVHNVRWADDVQIICSQAQAHARSTDPEIGFKNITIFPEGHHTQTDLPINFAFSDVSKISATDSAYIVGCIAYGSPFDDVIHQTGFASQLTTAGGQLHIGDVTTLFIDPQ